MFFGVRLNSLRAALVQGHPPLRSFHKDYSEWVQRRDRLFHMAPGAPRRMTIYLRSSRDIEVVKRHGRRFSTTFFNLLACRMDDAPTRVGIIVGRRFGNAVRRNRAKRVFRDLARELYPHLVPGRGLLVFPKRDALLQSREDLTNAWKSSLERMHLLRHSIKGGS